MAAVGVGLAQDLGFRLPQSTRNIVRTSAGGLYAVGADHIAGNEAIAVWYSSDGSSWAEKDAANRPVGDLAADMFGVNLAVDSVDKLHIFWYHRNGGSFQYTTFDTSTDQWNGGNAAAVTTVASQIDGPEDRDGPLVAITIDSADKAHVVWQDSDKVHGTPYDTVMYSNNVNGWKAGVQVEGYTAERQCRYPDITVNSSDIPCITYINATDNDITAAKGNQNDANAFTLKDVYISVDNSASSGASIACDSGGDIWVAFRLTSEFLITISKQSANWTDNWTSSTTDIAGSNPSLAIDGTDIYVFYEDTSDNISYNKYTGSWAGEVDLETGTYSNVKARWAQCNNYSYASVGIDYVFKSGNDMYWNTLSIAAPAVYKQQVIMID